MVPEKEQRQRNEQDIHKEGCLAITGQKAAPLLGRIREDGAWLQVKEQLAPVASTDGHWSVGAGGQG